MALKIKIGKNEDGRCVVAIAGLIPGDVEQSERSADIFLDAIQRKEAIQHRDVSD